MDTRNVLPQATKAQALHVQHVGQETLVYNDELHKAYCLNPVAAQVWRHLDGARSASQVAAAATVALRAPVGEETVLFTVEELRRDGLIEGNWVVDTRAIPTRREMLRRFSAGAVMLLPAVAVIMAPKAAQAYSGCVDCDVVSPNGPAGGPAKSSISDPATVSPPGGTRQPSSSRASDDGRELFVP